MYDFQSSSYPLQVVSATFTIISFTIWLRPAAPGEIWFDHWKLPKTCLQDSKRFKAIRWWWFKQQTIKILESYFRRTSFWSRIQKPINTFIKNHLDQKPPCGNCIFLPATPKLLRFAAMIPALWVPWPPSSSGRPLLALNLRAPLPRPCGDESSLYKGLISVALGGGTLRSPQLLVNWERKGSGVNKKLVNHSKPTWKRKCARWFVPKLG